MRHLKLFSLLLISSLALLASGCGSGGGSSSGSGGGSGQAAQTITFANPGTQTGAPLTLSATASSGLAVAFTSATTSVCTVSGTTATFVAAGTCTIDANQAGNSTYAAAPQVAQSFTVNAAGSQTATVYMAGYVDNSTGAAVAEEWQIASGSSTPVVTALPVPSDTTSSFAEGIAVSGSDVYVAGNVFNSAGVTAVYWENGGNATTLPTPSGRTYATATAITVSGSDVYVAGYASNSTESNDTAVYWVNNGTTTTATTLPVPSGTPSSAAIAIAVSGSDVYVAGGGLNSVGNEAVVFYWVNGTVTTLPVPSGTTSSEATGIAVSTQ